MIEDIKDLKARVSILEELLKNVIRVGRVVNRDEKKCMCRVEFKDNDKLISHWCQVLVPQTHKNKFFWLPDIDELVVVVFLPFGVEQGFIVGSVYNKSDKVPEDAKKDRILIEDSKDGNQFSNQVLMDRECEKMRIITKELHIFGNLIVHGTISDALGDLTNHTNAGYPRDPGGGAPPWDCS